MMDQVLVPKGKRWVLRRKGYYRSERERVVAALAHELDIAVDVLRGRARNDYLVKRRKIVAMVLIDTGAWPSEVARLLGRDPSTASHLLRGGRAQVERDPEFRALYERARRAVAEKVAA